MKFGIFFEISIPRPWTEGVEKQVYDNCIEQTVVADESGFEMQRVRWLMDPRKPAVTGAVRR